MTNSDEGSTKRQTVRDRLAAQPGLDLAVAAVLTVSYLVAMKLWPSLSVLAHAETERRMAIYGTGATVISLIAGFSGTAIAQYGSSSGPIVGALRGKHGMKIRRNWISILRWLLLSAVACIFCIAIDTNYSPRFSDYIFVAAITLAVIKFCRLSYIFRLMMAAADSDSGSGEGKPYGLGRGISGGP